MHHDTDSLLTWIPTRGNEIPPLTVPLQEGLYIARGLLGGEMHIGTTSPSTSGGARIRDKHGRSHDVFEYEVLTCASYIRFHLQNPPPTTTSVETTKTTSHWHTRRDVEYKAESPHPDSPARPKTPGKLVAFPWLSPRGQPGAVPHETHGKKYKSEPPPYSSPKGGWVEPPKQPHPMALSRREDVQFTHLARSKCFTLIDDTASMQNSWAQTRAALTGLIDIVSSDSSWDGLDVRFLHHGESRPCVKTAAEFERVFDSVAVWRGEKVMAEKASQVFTESFPLIHETRTPKPVIFLIISDGVAADNQQLYDDIIYFCQKLNWKSIPPHMFCIHWLQMGDDRNVVKPLHGLRDGISQRDGDRRIFNVVSFHRGRGYLNAQHIFKLLLASTHIPVEEDPDVGDRQAPEVIEAQYQEVDRIRMMGTW